MAKNDLADILSLDGAWDFSLGDQSRRDSIQVPGCWEMQGFSKFSDGPAVYRREINIPSSWSGKTIQAEFDAVSYACSVRLNGIETGSHRGMWTPFSVDLTQAARPGEQNLLELTIFKPGEHYPMRSSLAGFLPDVATSFGGLWQSARLRVLEFGISDLRVDADVDARCLHVRCRAVAPATWMKLGEWSIEVYQDAQLITREQMEMGTPPLDTRIPLNNMILWDPEHPDLYTVCLSLLEKGQPVAQVRQRVGFRRLSADGSQLLLNNKPFLIRGILSWGWEPDRIAPIYTPQQARAEMRRVRALGFNTIKLCLFVPNQAYFDVADEEGMLLWEEFPLWLPEVTDDLRLTAPREYADIAKLIAHHPSVALCSLGCELSRAVDSEFLGKLNQAVRDSVSNVMVCDNSGSGESYGGLDFDFSDFSDYHPYYDLQYFEPLLDNWRRDWQTPRPWIFGEFCDSDTFRDLDDIIKANNGAKPWWLTTENPVTTWRPESHAVLEEQERLAEAKLGISTVDLVRISYAQSLVIRKYTLETLRRRSGIGGYVITGLRDTPISTSGIWDDFNRPKWTAEEFSTINADALLSLDVDRRRKWIFGGDRPERLDPYNLWSGDNWRWHVILCLGQSGLPAGSLLSWYLRKQEEKPLAAGEIAIEHRLLPGFPEEIGTITCQLPEVQHPAEYRLEMTLSYDVQAISNAWPIWIYPHLPKPPASLAIFDPPGFLDEYGDWLGPVKRLQPEDDPSTYDLILSTELNRVLQAYITGGGRLLLLQQGNAPLPSQRCPFWREAIQLFCDHPLWNKFPQQGYAGMQFFGLASDIAFDIQKISQRYPFLAEIRPILRRLDARQFHVRDYLFEARVNRGILLACALRLQGGAGAQPFGWQRNVAGSAMLHALLDYLDGWQS